MFTGNKTIEDIVIDILGGGPLKTIALITEVNKIRPQTTKQAVYKALRRLRANETIAQVRGEVVLSSLWLKKLAEFTQKAQLNYRIGNQPSLDFLSLKNGEKITYWFKTFEATDMFWAHAFDVLADVMPPVKPIYIYNPHEWFLLARNESETFLFNQLREQGRKLFVLIGNRDQLDIAAAKHFNGKITSYYASPTPLFSRPNYYVNVFNDFLIEVSLDPEINAQIDEFYKKITAFDEAAKKELLEIIKQPGRNKLVIYRNERKAIKIQSMFKKIFV